VSQIKKVACGAGHYFVSGEQKRELILPGGAEITKMVYSCNMISWSPYDEIIYCGKYQ